MSKKTKPAETKGGKKSKSGYDALGPPRRGGRGGVLEWFLLVSLG